MKALTLTQPWAQLVAIGAKRIETRSWSTSYRGPLAIHAAVRFPLDCQVLLQHDDFERALGPGAIFRKLSRGSVVATCRLIDVVRIEVEGLTDIGVPDPGADLREGWKGQVWDAWRERAFGDFSVGRFAWLLDDVKPVDPPVAAKGRLGLWDWERPA